MLLSFLVPNSVAKIVEDPISCEWREKPEHKDILNHYLFKTTSGCIIPGQACGKGGLLTSDVMVEANIDRSIFHSEHSTSVLVTELL